MTAPPCDGRKRGRKTCRFPGGSSAPRTKCRSPACAAPESRLARTRRAPNWIEPPGCAIDAAAFVPTGAGRLVDAMSAWERDVRHGAP